MAVQDSSRRTRRSGRPAGNRPRFRSQHALECVSIPQVPGSEPCDGATLLLPLVTEIQARPPTVLPPIAVAASALNHQNAEVDTDVGTLRGRCAPTAIRSLDQLQRMLKHHAPARSKGVSALGDVP